MAIKSIDYNFGQFQDHREAGTTYDTFTVGKKYSYGVVEEIKQRSDENRTYYRVKFDNETVIDIYNASYVEHAPLVLIEVYSTRGLIDNIKVYKKDTLDYSVEFGMNNLVSEFTKDSFKPIPGEYSEPVDLKEAFEYTLRRLRETYKDCIIKEVEFKDE